MSSKAYVTDELLYEGRAYGRGEEVPGLSDESREQLLESGQLSTSKPKDEPAPQVGADGTPQVTISDFSDEEILAEAQERGLIEAGKVDYSELTVEELQAEAERREIDVERTDGKNGDPRKSDYVAALDAADSAS